MIALARGGKLCIGAPARNERDRTPAEHSVPRPTPNGL